MGFLSNKIWVRIFLSHPVLTTIQYKLVTIAKFFEGQVDLAMGNHEVYTRC